jgi:hypothetical protein
VHIHVDILSIGTSLRQGYPYPSLSRPLPIDLGIFDELLFHASEGLTKDLWLSCQGVQQGMTIAKLPEILRGSWVEVLGVEP